MNTPTPRSFVKILTLIAVLLDRRSSEAQIYVTDIAHTVVDEYPIDQGPLPASATTNVYMTANFGGPIAVAIAKPYFLVADQDAGTIEEFTLDKPLIPSLLLATGLTSPVSIVKYDTNVFVLSSGSTSIRIDRFDLNRTNQTPSNSTFVDSFSGPGNIGSLAISGSALLVANNGAQDTRINEYNAETGRPIGAIVLSGLSGIQGKIQAISVITPNLYLLAGGSANVFQYDLASGNFEQAIVVSGKDENGTQVSLNNPMSLTSAGNHLWVGDYGSGLPSSGQIVQIDTGSPVQDASKYANILLIANVNTPQGIATVQG